ncbi:MAG: hypothetical protein Q9160_008686 [Pyrenula sp. 1 TL-2023]
MHHTVNLAFLEQNFERVLRESERICEEERSRLLRVEVLFLQDENDSLQEQLADNDGQMEILESAYGETKEDLSEAEEQLRSMHNDLKVKSRDLESCKAEIQALGSVSADSTRLLTEKLALARELSGLKPEIEHLRSSAASHQSTLGEKLQLQRELSAVQVELETERRALQRTKAKDSKTSEDDAKVASQLEDARKELAKEKRENQRAERDARRQASEWEGQKAVFEGKLDAFRNKLRSTKEQLKETQKELEDTQAAKAAAAQVTVSKPSKNPRKRSIARFDPDMTIGTPGEGPAAKRNKSSSLPGDKSSFSITPFLNRTSTIIAPDSSDDDDQSSINPHTEVTTTMQIPLQSAAPSVQSSPSSKPQVSKKQSKDSATAKTKHSKGEILKETTAPKANLQTRKSTASTKSTSSLPRVLEESDEENSTAAASSTAQEPTSTINFSQVVKKKQKILGGAGRKSLFDDDDDEGTKPNGRGTTLGGIKGLGLRGGGVGGGPISLATKSKTLAEFSPLKKDRRAAAVAKA